jgi:hypothetical protein
MHFRWIGDVLGRSLPNEPSLCEVEIMDLLHSGQREGDIRHPDQLGDFQWGQHVLASTSRVKQARDAYHAIAPRILAVLKAGDSRPLVQR